MGREKTDKARRGRGEASHRPAKRRASSAAIGCVETIESYDGTRIGYRASGKGFPLVGCTGIACTMQMLKYVEAHFSRCCKILLWDYRGHGSSEKPSDPGEVRIRSHCRDLAALLDAQGIDRAVLLGYSMGVQVIFEFYHLYPERVVGLIALLGTYGRPFDTLFYTDRSRYLVPLLYLVGTRAPHLSGWVARRLLLNSITYALTRIIGFHASEEDMQPYYKSLAGIDWAHFVRSVRAMAEHTAEAVLPHVKVPTLAIAGGRDFMTPSAVLQKISAEVPDSELYLLEDATHTGNLEYPREINLRIERFLSDHFSGRGFTP